MRSNRVLLSFEKAARKAAHGALLAAIGRGLRERHDAAQPLPDRLADIVRRIDQPTGDRDRAEGEAGKPELIGRE
jgi:hypothetical protein